MKKVPQILLIIGAVCFLIIMGYSMAVEPWFTTNKISDIIRWGISSGVLLGLFVLFYKMLGRGIFIFGILFSLIGVSVGFLDLYRALRDRDEPGTPHSISLTDIESGKKAPCRYVMISGEILELRNVAFRTMKSDDGKEKVDKNYLPLLSASVFSSAVAKGEKPATFSILLEEKHYNTTFEDVHGEPIVRESIEGMFKKKDASSLDYQIKKHFEKQFPHIDWKSVYVLEDNARPYGAGQADRFATPKMFLSVSIPMLLFLIFLFFVAGKIQKEEAPAVEKEETVPEQE